MARPSTNHYGFIGLVVERRKFVRLATQVLRVDRPVMIVVEGPSGCGKSLLSQVAAAEIRGGCTKYIPETAECPLWELVEKSESGDVVFIDEAHTLTRKEQEILSANIDERFSGKNIVFVLATSRSGRLLVDLRNRATGTLTLRYYQVRELRDIAKVLTSEHPEFRMRRSDQAITALARGAGGVPRELERQLRAFKDFCRAELSFAPERTEVTRTHVRQFHRAEQIFPIALADRRYWSAISAAEIAVMQILRGAGAVSHRALIAITGVDDSRLVEIEGKLARCGFIKTARGRRLTAVAQQFLDTLEPRRRRNAEAKAL